MPAPLLRQFLPDSTHPAKVTRYIDNHYHLEMIAENNRQLVDYQAQSLRLQQEAAISNIRAMGEIAHCQDQTTNLLSTLVGGLDCLNATVVSGLDYLNDAMGRLSDGMDTLNATASEALDALYAQTEVLRAGFESIASRMMEQQRALEAIADILRQPYETKALELLKEADHALKNGMRASGRDREEEFRDSARLLRNVLDNPIGETGVAFFLVPDDLLPDPERPVVVVPGACVSLSIALLHVVVLLIGPDAYSFFGGPGLARQTESGSSQPMRATKLVGRHETARRAHPRSGSRARSRVF